MGERGDERTAWPRTETEARAVQESLLASVDMTDRAPAPGRAGSVVAGLDVAYDDERNLVAAAVVALDGESLEVAGSGTAVGQVTFPYVPGLLAFREVPALLEALQRLREDLGRPPDLLVCDGYGRAHPRRFGLASHLGVLTGIPAMGVAKNPFALRHPPLGPQRGDTVPLLAPASLGDGVPLTDAGTSPATAAGEEVGRVLRTRDRVKPVYVSVGHRIGLDNCCAHALWLTPRYRLPETTRCADALCRSVLRRHNQQG